MLTVGDRASYLLEVYFNIVDLLRVSKIGTRISLEQWIKFIFLSHSYQSVGLKDLAYL